eukprot:SAG11_NODE_1582_length_4646_cov_3.855949_1_plen_63_part_00
MHSQTPSIQFQAEWQLFNLNTRLWMKLPTTAQLEVDPLAMVQGRARVCGAACRIGPISSSEV